MHVHALRRALGADRIVTRAPGYLVRVEPGELDSDRFQELLERGEPHAALALWRGPALADLADEDFARVEATRLDEARLAAIEARIDGDLEAGNHALLTCSWKRSSPPTPTASDSAPSSCWPSTAPAARQTR